MLKTKLSIFFVLNFISIGLTVPLVQAQTSIRELQQNDRRSISISGRIVSVVGNEFILEDGTGQIIVDAGPRWYHRIDLVQGEEVTVSGEYDDYDFDAYKIVRSNGEVIEIRGPGRPPWAGGNRSNFRYK